MLYIQDMDSSFYQQYPAPNKRHRPCQKMITTNEDALEMILTVIPSAQKFIHELFHGNHTKEGLIIPSIPHGPFGSP